MRYVYGFNPVIVQALGYGNQVHNLLNLLHKIAQQTGQVPLDEEAAKLLQEHFTLRYAASEQEETLKKSALRSILRYLNMWREDSSFCQNGANLRNGSRQRAAHRDIDPCWNAKMAAATFWKLLISRPETTARIGRRSICRSSSTLAARNALDSMSARPMSTSWMTTSSRAWRSLRRRNSSNWRCGLFPTRSAHHNPPLPAESPQQQIMHELRLGEDMPEEENRGAGLSRHRSRLQSALFEKRSQGFQQL